MSDTRRALFALADTLEPKVARAFIRAINEVQSQAQLRLIVAAIKAGNIDDVFRILQIRPETFGLLEEQIRQVFIAGAAYQIDNVPGKQRDPATGAKLVVKFGGSQPRAQQIVTDLGAQLVTGITESVRETVRQTVRTGLENGYGAQRVALDLIGRTTAAGGRTGGVIGLSSYHADIVSDIRRAMREGDKDRLRDYLTFERRDKRFDGTIRRAIKGEKLTAKQIDRISGRLADGYLKLRGDAIARTETVPALYAGRREAVQQMIDRGVVRPWMVTRGWDATGDVRTRPDHLGYGRAKGGMGSAVPVSRWVIGYGPR